MLETFKRKNARKKKTKKEDGWNLELEDWIEVANRDKNNFYSFHDDNGLEMLHMHWVLQTW